MGDDTEIEKRIKEILGELAGATSLCWTETPKGIFDSTQAISFVQQATNKVLEALRGQAAQTTLPSRQDFYEWLGSLVRQKKGPPAYDDVYDWLRDNMKGTNDK